MMDDLEEDDYDYSRLDSLTKQKIGNPRILGWVALDTTKRQSKRLYAIAFATTFIVLLGIGTALWVLHKPRVKELPVTYAPIATAKISWQMANGVTDSLVFRDMKDDTAYQAGVYLIGRTRNQVFVFPWRDPATATKETVNYHFFVGGSQAIQVFFPDSSKWKVFPGTDLAFAENPRGVAPKKREITCNGEALFYVSPNCEIPTVIKTRKQEIRVLGTLFRCRDYQTEDTGAVFCYTGKVVVKDSDTTTKTLIRDQRATVRRGGGIKVSGSDFPDEKWSSPNLVFNFSNDNLETAMKEIARWYGISHVIYTEPIDKKTRGMVFTGDISRYLTLPQLLAIIERDDLHFSIEGNTIVVSGRDRRPDHKD